MNGIIKNKAFTLIELMVAITLITIVVTLSTNIDYNRLNIKQKLEIFTNSIKSSFETTRNNSLIGKGIGVELNVPEKWQIEYSKSNSGTIITSSYDGNDWIKKSEILFNDGFYISSIKCLELNLNENTEITSGTGIIEFQGSNLSLTGGCINNKSKILELGLIYKNEKKEIMINTLNGLIEVK